jgi:hypothetical protein
VTKEVVVTTWIGKGSFERVSEITWTGDEVIARFL